MGSDPPAGGEQTDSGEGARSKEHGARSNWKMKSQIAHRKSPIAHRTSQIPFGLSENEFDACFSGNYLQIFNYSRYKLKTFPFIFFFCFPFRISGDENPGLTL